MRDLPLGFWITQSTFVKNAISMLMYLETMRHIIKASIKFVEAQLVSPTNH